MFLFLTTVAFFHKGVVMMGSRHKTPRDDGNKTTETWLVCQSWAQAPGCGDPSLSAKRQTLVWPTDLLSHIYIHDTFQISRDKALFYITQSGQIPPLLQCGPTPSHRASWHFPEHPEVHQLLICTQIWQKERMRFAYTHIGFVLASEANMVFIPSHSRFLPSGQNGSISNKAEMTPGCMITAVRGRF